MKSADFRTSGYFSRSIIFFGLVLSFTAIVIFRSHIFIGLILFILSLVIFTTHYRLKVDFDQKTFDDYLWILSIKTGEKQKFEKIEYLFIKKGNVTLKMNNIVSSTTVRKEVYTGFLKFSETEKVELATENSKANLLKKLNKIATALNTKIVDYSDEGASNKFS